VVNAVFAPGFFASPQVHTALAIGGITAVVSAVVGVFTVVRGQSFAGHALTDASATGGSGMTLVGVNPLLGFVAGSLAAAGAMDALAARNQRGRDLATGIVLGAFIGLAALFLYLDTTLAATTGAPQQVLFGSIFTVAPGTVPLAAGAGAGALAILAAIYRPLIYIATSSDLAAAAGVPVRRLGVAYMVALGLAVALSSIAVGAILSTALLVGPAAAVIPLTRRIGRAVLAAAALGVVTTWAGILLAYDSSSWFSDQNGLPVSSFIVALVFLAYLVGDAAAWARDRRRPRRPPVTCFRG
jgi:zinc/manganese transport system permease protein